MKRKLSLFVALAMIVGLLAGCGGSSSSAPTESASGNDASIVPITDSKMPLTTEMSNMSIGTAGTSGTFYIMGSAYADLITRNLGINTIAEVTAGSTENVTLLDEDKVELGVIQLDVTLDAMAGEDGVPLRVITPMYPNVIQLVTLADSDINSFSDLKGKRVSVGSPGSGVLTTNEIILETLGLSMDDIEPQYLSFTETTDAFRNGAVDAVLVNTAAPAPFLVDLETTDAIKMIPFSDEEIAMFTEKFPFYVEATIPGGTYSSVPEDTKTFAVWIALMSKDTLPDDVAYNVAKTLFENGDYLKDVHVVAQYLNTDNVNEIKGVPYHPGVLQYLEDVGVTVTQ